MATGQDLRKCALALEGTAEQPHFDRQAFKARRIFATLAADQLTANIRLPPEEQEFRCAAHPDAYRPLPNKWGAQGWTTVFLSVLTSEELSVVLASAWRHQQNVVRGRR